MGITIGVQFIFFQNFENGKQLDKSGFVHFTNQHKPPVVLFRLQFSFGIIKPSNEGGSKP